MLNPPPFLRPLLAHPVAVFGGGLSGQAVLDLLDALGAKGQVYDEKAPAAASEDTVRPDFATPCAAMHRLVVFSPGFPAAHRWLLAARAAGLVCLSEVDFASILWRGQVVAVTGTNGKTTLTEFLTHALKSLGRDVTSTGNVGYAFSRLVAERGGGAPDSMAICEISSFQAETLHHFRADAALWTNFAEDHLERHLTMEAYFMAKWRLFERAVGGDVFAGSSVQRWATEFGQTLPRDSLVPTEDQPGDVLLRQTVFDPYPQRENFLLAAAWWRAAGLRETALYAAAQSFCLGPHRLSRIAENNGVGWWNDSKATNFHATEAALGRFRSPVWVILGGKAKGGDIAAFVARIAPRVKHALLIGETAAELARACQSVGLPYTEVRTLPEAVAAASTRAVAGDDVLLSPGFASFDQFRGYDDRGSQFEQRVGKLIPAPVFR